MSTSFQAQLRGLPDFPDTMPAFDPATAPADPAELFRLWLAEALAAGIRQPHAFSLATAGDGGRLSSRMLILKDIDDGGWHFATARTSRKGGELAAHPYAAMNFYWPELGRQIRVAGPVELLSAEASAADWDARPASDGTANPAWQLYSLAPRETEFWQARTDRRHIRHRLTFPEGS